GSARPRLERRRLPSGPPCAARPALQRGQALVRGVRRSWPAPVYSLGRPRAPPCTLRRPSMRERLSKFSSLSPAVYPKVWAVLLALTVIVIYSVSIGACGPWDPWETHYGEVARNIVERGDPMDL